MKKILCCAASLILALWMVIPAAAIDYPHYVSHGKTVSFEAGKTITIEEYDIKFTKENKFGNPTGKQSTFDVSTGLIGFTPTPGDMVKIAWDEKDGKKVVIRLQNSTKQDIMKK